MANQSDKIFHRDGAPNINKYPTPEELQKLVREDSILPETVCPTEKMSLINISDIEIVFLIGATGTLGPYLLRELSQRPNIKKVYCLVRKNNQASPMERLLKQLHTFQIKDHVDLAKVECIQGDIAEVKFGLAQEEYDRLANEVDAIFNSAVRASYIAKYRKSTEENPQPLHTVNVKGMIHVLEFAVYTKLKHVYHASTLLAIATVNEEGCAVEDWQDVGAFDESPYNWGYPLSKHISEQLCKQAVKRGIPCKVFRHPLIGGDSKSGRCDYANHFVSRWLTYLKLNYMPDTPVPMVLIAVDHCAQISLDIFFNPEAPSDIYNIAQCNTGMDRSIIQVADEFGIHIEPIPFPEFVNKSRMMENSPLSQFHSIYDKDGVIAAIHAEYENPTLTYYKRFLDNRFIFYASRKLAKFIDNYDELESTESVLRRDMGFLKGSGVFDKLGIKY